MEEARQLCGFNAVPVLYLVAQGFATPDNLLLASEGDLDTIARTVAQTPPRGGGGTMTMPFIALKNMKGLRFWADERRQTGFDAKPASLKPDSLKKSTIWSLPWNEPFQNYLRKILSAVKMPLDYLTRGEREEAPEALDPMDFANPLSTLLR